jgi:BirA family biotin operon repressor/biotin-[acetyl-CoA-carboxylase] ligase
VINLEKIKSAFSGSKFISEIYYFPVIESTNVYSKTLKSDNGALVLTDYQTRGLGRLNKTWESESEKNLTFTIKKHFDVDSENIQSVNFYFSYFLLAFLKDFITKNMMPGNIFPELFIKWPNDILLNSKKISGLLIDNNINKREFIIGVGININQDTFHQMYAGKTTSLKSCLNKEIVISEVLVDLINIYQKNIYLLKEKKYDIIYKLWKNSSCLINKEVEFHENNDSVRYGKIIDLMFDGGIKIEQNNEIFTYYSGEIKLHFEKPD